VVIFNNFISRSFSARNST